MKLLLRELLPLFLFELQSDPSLQTPILAQRGRKVKYTQNMRPGSGRMFCVSAILRESAASFADDGSARRIFVEIRYLLTISFFMPWTRPSAVRSYMKKIFASWMCVCDQKSDREGRGSGFSQIICG